MTITIGDVTAQNVGDKDVTTDKEGLLPHVSPPLTLLLVYFH